MYFGNSCLSFYPVTTRKTEGQTFQFSSCGTCFLNEIEAKVSFNEHTGFPGKRVYQRLLFARCKQSLQTVSTVPGGKKKNGTRIIGSVSYFPFAELY